MCKQEQDHTAPTVEITAKADKADIERASKAPPAEYHENLDLFLRYKFDTEHKLEDAFMAYQFCKAIGLLDHRAECVDVMVAVELLYSCHYSEEDVKMVLAAALANMKRQTALLNKMSPRERSMVSVLHIFIGHSVLLDEFVPLKVWYDWLFATYCSFPCLNSTVIQVLSLWGRRVHVREEDLMREIEFLNAPLSNLQTDDPATGVAGMAHMELIQKARCSTLGSTVV